MPSVPAVIGCRIDDFGHRFTGEKRPGIVVHRTLGAWPHANIVSKNSVLVGLSDSRYSPTQFRA